MLNKEMQKFRSRRLYQDDFPSDSVKPPFKELGLPPYNVQRMVDLNDANHGHMTSHYVMTV